jgi:His-Xaa-Ser system radical SAM maturase HxsC
VIVRLDNYTFGRKIASLALTEEAAHHLSCEHTPFMYLQTKTLTFFPGGETVELGEFGAKQLSQCDDYDVFQIDELGRAYQCYDNESGDNVIMLTARCNSNCIMCPAIDKLRKTDTTPTVDEYLEIIRHIPTDARHITITGGEPFLVGERIFEVFGALKDKLHQTQFLLLTNGRALSYDPFIEQFNRTIPENTIIGIPLHGYNAETHDRITRSPGGFEQTICGIKNLLRYRHSVELRMVVGRLNCDSILKIAELIASELSGVFRVEIMGLEMMGNAAIHQDQVWLPYRDAFQASKEAIDLLIHNGITVGLYNFPLCAVDREYHHIAAKSISGYKIRYAEACERCQIKDACGGIFAGTIRLAGQDVRPVSNQC